MDVLRTVTMAVDQENSPAPGRRPLRGKITALPPLTFRPGGAVGHRTARSRSFLKSGEPKTRSNLPSPSAVRGTQKIKKIRRGPGPAGTKLSDAQRGGCPAREESPAVDRQAGWLVSAGWGWGRSFDRMKLRSNQPKSPRPYPLLRLKNGRSKKSAGSTRMRKGAARQHGSKKSRAGYVLVEVRRSCSHATAAQAQSHVHRSRTRS